MRDRAELSVPYVQYCTHRTWCLTAGGGPDGVRPTLVANRQPWAGACGLVLVGAGRAVGVGAPETVRERVQY